MLAAVGRGGCDAAAAGNTRYLLLLACAVGVVLLIFLYTDSLSAASFSCSNTTKRFGADRRAVPHGSSVH